MREQAVKLRKQMRCSDLQRKPVEVGRNDLSTRKSLTMGYQLPWQAGGKARFIYLPPGYNNDPCMLRHTAGASFYQGSCIEKVVQDKSLLIDLKTYCEQEAA